jgi:hypothetical protein
VATFCDPNQMVNRKSPGELHDWITFVIMSACFVTFVAVTLGVDLVFNQIDRAVDRGWVPYGLTFVVAFCTIAAWLPPAKLSRALRVAVVLPGVHALVLALAWPAWHALSRFINDRSTTSELATHFPIALGAAATIVAFIVFACVVARRRSGEWLHGFVMLALTELMLLGMWLPISCSVWPGGEGEWWTSADPVVVDARSRVLLSIVPPTIVALGFTAFALRKPSQLLRARPAILAIVGAGYLFAFAVRLDASAREMVLYSNLLPILLTAMVVAIAALIIFGTALAIRSFAAQHAFKRKRRAEGVIVRELDAAVTPRVVTRDDAPVFGFEITSWLRGPRVVQRSFAVSIAGATIPVNGAHLVAPLPAATTQLQIGESFAVLRPGDRVTIAGHARATGDPFRTSAAPLAGELFIAPAERGASSFAHVALAMWRPCVAYLLIVVAVALPALAALAAS